MSFTHLYSLRTFIQIKKVCPHETNIPQGVASKNKMNAGQWNEQSHIMWHTHMYWHTVWNFLTPNTLLFTSDHWKQLHYLLLDTVLLLWPLSLGTLHHLDPAHFMECLPIVLVLCMLLFSDSYFSLRHLLLTPVLCTCNTVLDCTLTITLYILCFTQCLYILSFDSLLNVTK